MEIYCPWLPAKTVVLSLSRVKANWVEGDHFIWLLAASTFRFRLMSVPSSTYVSCVTAKPSGNRGCVQSFHGMPWQQALLVDTYCNLYLDTVTVWALWWLLQAVFSEYPHHASPWEESISCECICLWNPVPAESGSIVAVPLQKKGGKFLCVKGRLDSSRCARFLPVLQPTGDAHHTASKPECSVFLIDTS